MMLFKNKTDNTDLKLKNISLFILNTFNIFTQ